jgi:hypothetical protein
VVAAPSKLQRPAGDRVKARLLRMDQIVEVWVPGVAQEAARDLVPAREDVRGDLMRCWHRLSIELWLGGQATATALPGRSGEWVSVTGRQRWRAAPRDGEPSPPGRPARA